MKKSTDELLNVLKQSRDVDSYLSQEQENFSARPLHSYFSDLFRQKGISPSECIQSSGLDRTYCYQILSGAKRPSRDKALALCFGMSLGFEETQQLLKSTGYPMLYPRNERDSVIIFALQRKLSILDLNHLLYEAGYDAVQ